MLNEDFEKTLNQLNEKQRQAVDTIEGPVVVVAGPGTGKTKILTVRIANILKKTDTSPENILALTYTTAGVISMREKLIEIIGDRAYRVNIFTFHAFCEHIIKEFSFYFEKLEGFRVIEALERVEIIENIIDKNDFEHLVSFNDKFSFLNKIAKGILVIKGDGLSPLDFINSLPVWQKDLLSDEDIYYKKNSKDYKKGDLKPAEKEKIVWGNISYNSEFSLVDKNIYVNAPANILTSSNVSIKFLIACLNSSIFNYEFKQKGIFLGKAYEWKRQYVENVHIPIVTKENFSIINQMEILVDKIISLKKQDPKNNTQELENQIDQLVYKLYDLDEEEIKIIENRDSIIS